MSEPAPRFGRSLFAAAAFAWVLASPSGAQLLEPSDTTTVDLELVLLVDVSPSMDYDEYEIQRAGYVEAFRHDEVIDAILSGPRGRIAVTYVEWGDTYEQAQIVPWTLIASPEDAAAFADRLASEPIYGGSRTSMSVALMRGASLLDGNEYEGFKRVIDISGDGPNNSGPPVVTARDEIAARGITVNGLPIVLRRTDSAFDIPNLDAYYEDCVITGAGSFSAPVESFDDLGPTIRGKLVLEIAGLPPRLVPAQFLDEPAREKADCLIGEKLWRQRGFGFQ